MSDIVYVIEAKAVKVEEKQQIVRGFKDANGDASFVIKSLGWFIHFEGSHEAINLGMIKPDIAVGQKCKITIEALHA